MANNLSLSTPAIWYPGQSESDFEEEIGLMLVRAQWTKAFLDGEIHPDTFLDFLDEQGMDVLGLAENCWNIPVV